MEELWKDMSLTSTPAALQYHHHLQYSPAAAPYGDRAVYLEEYLATASVPPLTPPPPPPHTALTLSSSLWFNYHGRAGYSGSVTGPASNYSTSSGDDSLHVPDPFAFSFPNNNSSSYSNSNSTRRVAAQAVAAAAVGSDGRKRRMIKNRESAARSRARKQAYTNELELELAQLKRENHMLVKREEDFHARMATAAEVPADRSTLQRCRSAPAP